MRETFICGYCGSTMHMNDVSEHRCPKSPDLAAENAELREQVRRLREALSWIETRATQQQLVEIRDLARAALAETTPKETPHAAR